MNDAPHPMTLAEAEFKQTYDEGRKSPFKSFGEAGAQGLARKREGTSIGMGDNDAGARDFEKSYEKDKLLGKEDVNYRYAPNPDEKSCGNCRNYDGNNGCSLVAGLIRPIDVCDEWEAGKKKGDASPADYFRQQLYKKQGE